MDSKFVINADYYEKAIPILESRSFLEQKESRQILLSGLCQLDHFKALMRDQLLEHHLYPYLDEFAQQVSYKYIPKGKIIFHDGENLSCLFFVLRGQFTEFKHKSEETVKKELYWDNQAESFKEELAQVNQSQRNLQIKRTQELLEINNGIGEMKEDDITDANQTIDADKMNLQQKQLQFLRQKKIEQELAEKRGMRKNTTGTSLKKQATLEEVFFTEEFKKKSSKLKQANEMANENVKFYSGSIEEDLLKLDNKHQERYFRDHRCIYKKSKSILPGMQFGELYGEEGKVDGTIVCSEQAFLLSIPSRQFQRIFDQLTQRLNYVFHVLANQFPNTKKVILHDFAFQFKEQKIDFNEVLFHEGDSPDYVYIMKSGDIDYRKRLRILNEYHEKRLNMINQGEIFGQEDIFLPARNYSVHSCVNNSIVYKIQKDVLLLFQFMQQLKQSVKIKSDYLSKKYQEMLQRNSLPQEANKQVPQLESSMQSKSQKSLIMSKTQMNSQMSSKNQQNSVITTHSNTPGQGRRNSSLNKASGQQSPINQVKSGTNSLQNFSSAQSLSYNQSASYFFQSKGFNFGESDYDLTFKSFITSPSNLNQNPNPNAPSEESQQQTNKNVSKQKQKGGNTNTIAVTFTNRAQPESVYSRIIRPDSGFKEEIEQMKKEKAEQLSMFNIQDNQQQNNTGISHKRQNTSKNSKDPEFKLSRIEVPIVTSQLKSDQRIKRAQAESSERRIEISTLQNKSNSQLLENKEIKSTKNSNNKEQVYGFKDELIQNNFIEGMYDIDGAPGISKKHSILAPRGTASSLKKYKDYAKDYFDKDHKPKFADFFAEFQSFSSGIQAKQMYEKLHKNEVKEDPFSHINFNIAEQFASNQQILSTRNQITPLNKGGKRTFSFSQNNQNKNLYGLPQNRSPCAQDLKEGNKLPLMLKDHKPQNTAYIMNSYNSSNIGNHKDQVSPVFTEHDDYDYDKGEGIHYFSSKNQSSEKHQAKKLRFATIPLQQQQQEKEESEQKDSQLDESVLFQLRDNVDTKPKDSKKGIQIKNFNSMSALEATKFQIEKNNTKQLENSMSFNKLRSLHNLRLGPPLSAQQNNFHMRHQFRK